MNPDDAGEIGAGGSGGGGDDLGTGEAGGSDGGGSDMTTAWAVSLGLLVMAIVALIGGALFVTQIAGNPLAIGGVGTSGGSGGASGATATADPAVASTATTESTVAPTGTGTAEPGPTRTTVPSPSSAVFRETFDDATALTDWTIQQTETRDGSDNTGDAYVDDGELELVVFRCYRVSVSKSLGEHTGRLRISFDWHSRAEQWWERPTWNLTDGQGNPYNYTVVSDHDLRRPPKGGERSGHTVVEADVDGEVVLTFGIVPSNHCDNANHRETWLTVDNVVVRALNETG